MVFQPEVTKQDEGLYTCQASFYHHSAMVSFQVDIMCKDRLLCEDLLRYVFHLHDIYRTKHRLYQHSDATYIWPNLSGFVSWLLIRKFHFCSSAEL